MKRDERPRTWRGLQRPAVARCSQSQDTPTAATINPSLSRKSSTRWSRSDDRGSSGGRNEAWYDANARIAPPASRARLRRRSACAVARRVQQHPHGGPRRQEARPRKEREIRQPGNRPEVAFEGVWQPREHVQMANRGRYAAPVPAWPSANAAIRAARLRKQRPHRRRRHHRRAHDVEDVDLEQRPRWREAEDERLEPEDEGEPKICRPALGAPRAPPPGRRRDGAPWNRPTSRHATPARNRKSGAAKPPRMSELPECARVAVRGTRPRVDDVRLDHDQHGHAAQHVEISPPVAGVAHSETVKRVSKGMSCRIECHTEQYFLVRQVDGALDLILRDGAGHGEIDRDAR